MSNSVLILFLLGNVNCNKKIAALLRLFLNVDLSSILNRIAHEREHKSVEPAQHEQALARNTLAVRLQEAILLKCQCRAFTRLADGANKHSASPGAELTKQTNLASRLFPYRVAEAHLCPRLVEYLFF